ncbi:MAG: hypothetical protein ACOCXQ_02140 [Patescibacteria group bacterium]
MKDPEHLKQQLREIYSIEPNDLHMGLLTRIYKQITRHLKQMPFIYIIPLAFLTSIGLYLIFGQLVVGLVSLLQYGS